MIGCIEVPDHCSLCTSSLLTIFLGVLIPNWNFPNAVDEPLARLNALKPSSVLVPITCAVQ